MPVADDRPQARFRLVVVPGVTVASWGRTWSERLPAVDLEVVPAEAGQAAALLAGGADAGLIRLPVGQETFHAIPLYTEVSVVVVQRDHFFAAADEVTVADLLDETLVRPLDDVLVWTDASAAPAFMAADRPDTTAAAVELVAAGAGVLVVPQSLARLHHRRDLTYRAVTDAPTSSVGLAWVRDRHTGLVEEMIGVVRGRTANSTRGRVQTPAPPAKPSTTRRTPTPGQPGERRGGVTPTRSPRRRGR
ncbi:MAG TPA: LysR family transcriptional regulator substrate-binding protein [Micromonosporaceae bacterium]|nr:LysR family transcriptional regulator substrate-binding protein [Micromonosporaceae bacterium]